MKSLAFVALWNKDFMNPDGPPYPGNFPSLIEAIEAELDAMGEGAWYNGPSLFEKLLPEM
jgi:hypothetical protein